MTHAALLRSRSTGLFGLAAIVIAFTTDQLAKQVALAALSQDETLRVLPFFNVRLSFNEGIIFGMYAQVFAGRAIVLVSLTLTLLVFLVAFLLLWSSTRWEALALGTIVGGALGNVVDRLRVGAVIDFLNFHLWGIYWAALNLADSAVAVCVVILSVMSFSRPRT